MRATDLLLPLTPLYAAAVRTRAHAYEHRLLATQRLPAPVVSVGNLAFGGTGKTPTVAALARDLVRRGRHPAVLTRGYRRRGRDPLLLVGPEPGVAVDAVGDEALELAGRLPGVPVVVDADRARGGRMALRAGADCLLLDDGFQHLRLERELDIVLLDAGDPWAGGRLPPRGRLREPRSALARASAVLVTRLEPDDPRLATIADEIERLAPHLPVLGARVTATGLRTPDGPEPAASLAGRRVVALAGVGRPQAFIEMLVGLGAELVASRLLRDHHRYAPGELDAVLAAAEAEGAVVVTTAKDAVKLPVDAPLWVVEIEMQPLTGSWNELWAIAPGLLA